MLGGSMSNKTLVAMKREAGTVDSEIHFEGHIVKPDQAGVVLIPSEFVLAMMMAGYVHTTQT
jgi:hypothetical protein